MLRTVRNSVIQFVGSNNQANGVFRSITQRQIQKRDLGLKGHSSIKIVDHGCFSVEIYPALSDNFMYLIKPKNHKGAIAIDPVDHRLVSFKLAGSGYYLDSILCTHHHGDHDGGNAPLLRLYPELKIYATDERVNAYTHMLNHLTKFSLCGLEIRTLHTPCHTTGHGCFIIVSESGPSAVFVGDTLFHAGAGRFFEGSASEFITARDTIFDHVEDLDLMYPGHEYSLSNLKFSATVEPDNEKLIARLAEVEKLRESKEPTIPTEFKMERDLNPFVRLNSPQIQLQTGSSSNDEESVCATLREMKNNF